MADGAKGPRQLTPEGGRIFSAWLHSGGLPVTSGHRGDLEMDAAPPRQTASLPSSSRIWILDAADLERPSTRLSSDPGEVALCSMDTATQSAYLL
ncbi:hypothetical protein EYF80_011500 [Liparis tanakae]|uniref:Uncharacterized protein n=1 Tax=Liparis tanakae TaxID=230148 RepID=A0A4Z2IJS5_9TELE|nr:hypothetical protein EYF80_011500 [Liparis tanakae]